MKAKQLLSLIVVFLIIAGVFFAKKSFIKQDIELEEYKKLEIDLEPSVVSEIKIDSPKGESVNLIEKEGSWILASKWNLRAKGYKVEELLKGLNNLSGEIRSTSKALLDDYAISEDKAYTITLSTESSQLQKFLIGNKRPSSDSSFLRKDDSYNVYLVNENIFSLLGVRGDGEGASLDQDFWVELSLLQVEIDKVESLQIVKISEKSTLVSTSIKKELDAEKNLKRWIIVGDYNPIFDIDASKIKNYLSQLAGMRAMKAVERGKEGYGLEVPFLRIFLVEDGKEKELTVGSLVSEQSKDRYVSTSEGNVYVLSGSIVQSIDIDISKFFIDNPLRIEKERLKSVTVSLPAGKTIIVTKDLIEKNADYIGKLKRFCVEKVLFDDGSLKGLVGAGEYKLTIVKEDESSVILNVKEKAIEEGGFLTWLDGAEDRPFIIENKVFEDIFENLDQINLDLQGK
jgi:hypothetical protein